MNITGKDFFDIKLAVLNQEKIKFNAVENIVILKSGNKIDLNKRYSEAEQSYIYQMIRPFRIDI